MPSDKTSLTSLWNPHRGKVKGEMEVEFLPTCGAALEKQSAAALPSLTLAFPGFLVWGFSGRWPQRAPSHELAFRYPRGASWSRVAD